MDALEFEHELTVRLLKLRRRIDKIRSCANHHSAHLQRLNASMQRTTDRLGGMTDTLAATMERHGL